MGQEHKGKKGYDRLKREEIMSQQHKGKKGYDRLKREGIMSQEPVVT